MIRYECQSSKLHDLREAQGDENERNQDDPGVENVVPDNIEPNQDDPGVENVVPDNIELRDEVFVPGGVESEANREQTTDEAYRCTLEHAARREA